MTNDERKLLIALYKASPDWLRQSDPALTREVAYVHVRATMLGLVNESLVEVRRKNPDEYRLSTRGRHFMIAEGLVSHVEEDIDLVPTPVTTTLALETPVMNAVASPSPTPTPTPSTRRKKRPLSYAERTSLRMTNSERAQLCNKILHLVKETGPGVPFSALIWIKTQKVRTPHFPNPKTGDQFDVATVQACVASLANVGCLRILNRDGARAPVGTERWYLYYVRDPRSDEHPEDGVRSAERTWRSRQRAHQRRQEASPATPTTPITPTEEKPMKPVQPKNMLTEIEALSFDALREERERIDKALASLQQRRSAVNKVLFDRINQQRDELLDQYGLKSA